MQTRASNGQSLDYQYDGAGQLIRIQDNYLGQTSSYTYDLAGNRITERVTQKTTLASGEVADVVYQDNKLFYDGQNRLYYAIDGRAEVRIAYDRSGNRSTVETRVLTELADKGQPNGIKETLNASTVTYTYDSMNRQLSSTKRETVKSGTGTLLESHVYTYDLAGNRRSDAAYVKGGGANGADTGGTYVYTYDDLHRLVQSQRGTDELFQYYYDGAGRTVINPELAEGFVGPIDPYKIWKRVESPTQKPEITEMQVKSSELWGHANRGSDTPQASALRGFLTENQKGIEFVTAMPLGKEINPKLGSQVNWPMQPGMRSFVDPYNGKDAVSLPIIIINRKQ